MDSSYLIDIIIESYKKIEVVSKIEDMLRFTDFENRLISFNKERILDTLDSLGYEFEYNKARKEFSFHENENNISFKVSLNINGGIVLPYIYVFIDDQKVPYNYPSLIFTYKYLKEDFDTLMNPSTVYTSYKDFKEIMQYVLNIYEDFKAVFLSKIKCDSI